MIFLVLYIAAIVLIAIGCAYGMGYIQGRAEGDADLQAAFKAGVQAAQLGEEGIQLEEVFRGRQIQAAREGRQ